MCHCLNLLKRDGRRLKLQLWGLCKSIPRISKSFCYQCPVKTQYLQDVFSVIKQIKSEVELDLRALTLGVERKVKRPKTAPSDPGDAGEKVSSPSSQFKQTSETYIFQSTFTHFYLNNVQWPAGSCLGKSSLDCLVL